MQISRLQYITNYQSEISHVDQVKQVVDAGLNWIQYRPKETTDDLILSEGKEIASFCKQHAVTFIMNDRIDMAMALDADGVHLGKNDRSPMEARELLGKDKIIGGTANTEDDILNLVAQGVDYIGLGPYKFTATKKNLSPVLGLQGYSQIISSLSKQGVTIPIVAIGGIKETDIAPLKETGIHGIALSSLLSSANNISLKATELLNFFLHKQNLQ